MHGVLFTTLLTVSCAIAQQFNPGFPGQWNQRPQNFNGGFGSQRLPQNRPPQGQFPSFQGAGINQGQNSFNQFGSNQGPFQNGQQQGQFSSQLGSNGQAQNSFNQLGAGSQQQQQQPLNTVNGAGLSSFNQQGSNSAGSSSSGNQGSSTNINQILWNSNQNDYQCVINNCGGQNGPWNPVCGTDNLVYDNVAILRCAQQCGRRISFNYAGTCVVTTTAASRKR